MSQEPDNLSPKDADAIEAVLHRAAGQTVPPVDPEREARIDAWLKILAAAPAAQPRRDLLTRTLAAVGADAVEETPAPLPFVRPMWQRRLAEFGAMAVAASIFVAVLFVGVSQSRLAAGRTACAEGLQKFANAFGTFAADNGGTLPALAAPSDHNFLHSTDPAAARSNTGNLLPLINAKYVPTTVLICAGNPTTPAATANDLSNIGYSYAYMTGPSRPHWGKRDTLVLSDKNPMFFSGAATSAAFHNSANHGERGNYLLHGDGSLSWESSPFVGPTGDNLWTVNHGGQPLLTYTGTEAPASATDHFLAP